MIIGQNVVLPSGRIEKIEDIYQHPTQGRKVRVWVQNGFMWFDEKELREAPTAKKWH